MANNGNKSVAVTSYDTLRFTWWQSGEQNIAKNLTTIGWELQLISGAYGAINSTASKAWSVNVNGTAYSGTTSVNIGNNTTKVLASGYTNITHNADGTKTFSYSFSQNFGITFSGATIGTISGSGSGTLNSISRKAILTAAPNFNDEENVTITYSNPAGNAVDAVDTCISWTGGDDIKYRAVSKTGTSYTYNFTEAERETMRAAVKSGTTITVRFYIRTTINGAHYYSTLDKTLTLINAHPTINHTIKDVGSVSTALTGDSSKIIRYYNYLEVTTGAEARKGATIVSQTVTCGDKSFSGSSGFLPYVESEKIVIVVTDSRGNSLTRTITKSFIEYINLTCNLTVDTPTTDGSITYKVDGNCWYGNFGATYNSLRVESRIKEGYGEWSEWKNESVVGYSADNRYEGTKQLTNLDYTKSYTIQVRAFDRVKQEGVYTQEITVKAMPVFDWGENDFNFNVPVSINNVEIDYIVEQGETNGWFYRKWNSGIAECWQVYYGNGINAGVNNMNGFYYSNPFTVNLPFAFANIPTVTVDGGSLANMNFARVFGVTNDRFTVTVVGAVSLTNVSVTLHFRAIGKWK
jgi:hypothetical protein